MAEDRPVDDVQIGNRLDLVARGRQDRVPRAGQAVGGGQQRQVSRVPAGHRFQVVLNAVESLGQNLRGRAQRPAAGRRAGEVEAAWSDQITQPGLDADLGHLPVQPRQQPPGSRAQGRAQGAVLRQRADVHEQVPDPGLPQPGHQGAQVGRGTPAIDPRMPQPQSIVAPDRHGGRHGPDVLAQQADESRSREQYPRHQRGDQRRGDRQDGGPAARAEPDLRTALSRHVTGDPPAFTVPGRHIVPCRQLANTRPLAVGQAGYRVSSGG